MQNGLEYPISSGTRDWLKLQAQRRGAYHERCRLMRIHVLDELALQLWAHKQSAPGAFHAPEARDATVTLRDTAALPLAS